MTDLVFIPIEPISERYSEQWRRNFPIEFTNAGYNVVTLDGVPLLNDEIKVGTFLDANSTVHYKMTQLQQISALFHEGKIKHGTVFFFADIEFWGLESVRLLAQMNNIDVKITGFLHAGSYTHGDAFAVAASYQRYTEVGWVAALDAVFVGSEYHKQAFVRRRLAPLGAEYLADRIKVTKNPVFIDEYPVFDVPKQKKVLLTNRFDPEKRPDETLELFAPLKSLYPDWEFVVTTGRPILRGDPDHVRLACVLQSRGIITIKVGLTKEQYHKELSEAYMVVSHSREESYGYCIAESILYGCVPLLYDGASHPEFVGPNCLFSGGASAMHKASKIMDSYTPAGTQLPLDTSGMRNIISEISALTS